MFRKKDTVVSTTKGLQKEAQKFQKVVAEINKSVRPEDISINILNAYAEKNKIEISVLNEPFGSYLNRNALNAVRKVKTGKNYNVIDLEQAVEAFGLTTDELGITFFSEE
jgi:topoisomerase IA-like protein